MGWGPGRSGAYWTLRITRRTEFLGGDRERRTRASRCLRAALPAGCPLSWPILGQIALFFWAAGSGEGWCKEVPAGCPPRLGCEGAAPRPRQAVRMVTCHGWVGIFAHSAAVGVSIPTPRSSLPHPYPGEHLHPSSTLGNTSIPENISIPGPAWRTSLSQPQPGEHLQPRSSLENISVPAPAWRTSPSQVQLGGPLCPSPILEDLSAPAPSWRASPSQPHPGEHFRPSPIPEDISIPFPSQSQRTSPSQPHPGGPLHPSPIPEDLSVPAPSWRTSPPHPHLTHCGQQTKVLLPHRRVAAPASTPRVLLPPRQDGSSPLTSCGFSPPGSPHRKL